MPKGNTNAKIHTVKNTEIMAGEHSLPTDGKMMENAEKYQELKNNNKKYKL